MNHDGAAADASGDSESRPIALSSDSSEGEPVASEDEGVGVAL